MLGAKCPQGEGVPLRGLNELNGQRRGVLADPAEAWLEGSEKQITK